MRADMRIVAICVTYHPDPGRLARVLAAIGTQVDAVLVIDNSECGSEAVARLARTHDAMTLNLPGNPGLAAAFNRGIEHARASALAPTHVLLLDQDSIAEPGMVDALAREWERIDRTGNPGAFGPAYVDEISRRAAVVLRFRGLRRMRVDADQLPPGACEPTDMLISSGSLIALATCDLVGPMDETLFIDHVDTDWVFRANRAGRTNYVVRDAGMAHRLGERSVAPGLLGRRTLVLHRPFRLYYIVRNSLLLYRRPHASVRWIVFDIKRLILLMIGHLAYGPERGAMLGHLAHGLFDGARGRGGPRPRH